MTITPNWLEAPAKVELTQGDLVILVPVLQAHIHESACAGMDVDYRRGVIVLKDKLHAAFRGPKL